MPKGVYDRKRAKRKARRQAFRQAGPALVAKPGQHVRQGQLTLAGMEPLLPTVHIERGSGGDVRYSVRVPAPTAAGAVEEAKLQFQALRTFVESLKGNGQL